MCWNALDRGASRRAGSIRPSYATSTTCCSTTERCIASTVKESTGTYEAAMTSTEAQVAADCERFQRIAWSWLQSGEMTRTFNMLSPIEELCGYNYGFVYLLDIDECSVKIGFSEHVQRRIRELQPAYSKPLRLRACFVGDREAERFAHRRFANLHVKNELIHAASADRCLFRELPRADARAH